MQNHLLRIFSLGMFLFVLPSFAYQYSGLVGWSQRYGFEEISLAALIIILLAHFLISRKSPLVKMYLFVWPGLIIGLFVPGILNEPWWLASSERDSSYDNIYSESFESNHLKKNEQKLKLARVAHAGGSYSGYRYTNSIESLQSNRDFYDFFEVDLSFTSDDEFVCVHDWPRFWRDLTGLNRKYPPTYAEFKEISLRQDLPYTPCDLETLLEWAMENPKKYIVLDLKVGDSVSGYDAIGKTYSNEVQNLIPQIYDPADYDKINRNNWAGIIWTMYKKPLDVQSALSYWTQLDLLAITVPVSRVEQFVEAEHTSDLTILTHTINDLSELARLKSLGVAEVYTDYLKEFY